VEEEKVTRTAGLYPLYKWNQYEAAVEMWPRTNNSSEGSYVCFSSTLNIYLWKHTWE
jgi:hypothetical protein